jgi:1-acyl-sn-glycerol-3-phosphate acyltransferase
VWYRFAQLCAQAVFLLFFGIRAYGQRNVPDTGGVILASTHQSYLDPMIVELGLTRPGHIMARRSLFRNPLFGKLIRSLHAFPLERNSADLGAMRKGVTLLKSGSMLLLFPEGTRTRTGEIGEIMGGLALMALQADVPVVPVAIDGAFECWPKGQALPHPGRIRVMYGKPMRPTSRRQADRERFIVELRDAMVTQQARLRRIAGRRP